MLGIDFAYGRPRANVIANDGYGFVMRYLSPPPNGKNLNAGEVADYQSKGIHIGLVFESYANRANEGYGSGVQDAQTAHDTAKRLGLENQPIFFAVDWDVQAYQFDSVDAYMRGVRNVLGPYTGVYAGYPYIRHALDNGLATWAWQTEAWSRGNEDQRIHIIQRIGYVYVDGVECDKNEMYKDIWTSGGNTVSVWDEQITNTYGTFPAKDILNAVDAHVNAVVDALGKPENSRVAGSTVKLTARDAMFNADMYGYLALDQLGRIVTTLSELRHAVDALDTKVTAIAAKSGSVTGTFPVNGNITVG